MFKVTSVVNQAWTLNERYFEIALTVLLIYTCSAAPAMVWKGRESSEYGDILVNSKYRTRILKS